VSAQPDLKRSDRLAERLWGFDVIGQVQHLDLI